MQLFCPKKCHRTSPLCIILPILAGFGTIAAFMLCTQQGQDMMCKMKKTGKKTWRTCTDFCEDMAEDVKDAFEDMTEGN